MTLLSYGYDEKNTEDELLEKLENACAIVEVGAKYKHYKGGIYTVTNLAILEDSEEVGVIYQAEYGNNLAFIRSLESWNELVESDGSSLSRFTHL